jgi:hypothetical protein
MIILNMVISTTIGAFIGVILANFTTDIVKLIWRGKK